jgi:hypothetical protein
MERCLDLDDVRSVMFGIYDEYKAELKEAREWGDEKTVRTACHDVDTVERILDRLGFRDYWEM